MGLSARPALPVGTTHVLAMGATSPFRAIAHPPPPFMPPPPLHPLSPPPRAFWPLGPPTPGNSVFGMPHTGLFGGSASAGSSSSAAHGIVPSDTRNSEEPVTDPGSPLVQAAKKRPLSVAFPELPGDSDGARFTWRDGLHSDWTLLLGQRPFKVHKVVVGTGERRSHFLVAAFRKQFAETSETCLSGVLLEACHDHFEDLLDYFYNGELVLNGSNWASMMKMADALQIRSLHELCASEFGSCLSPSNAVEICSSTVNVGLEDSVRSQVFDRAIEAIAPQFLSGTNGQHAPSHQLREEVRRCKGGWAAKLLAGTLAQDCLEIVHEDDVFDLVQQAVPSLSSADAATLWSSCRLAALSPRKLLEAAQVEEIPRTALAWAGVLRSQDFRPNLPAPPGLVAYGPRLSCHKLQFLVAHPLSQKQGEMVSSPWKRLPAGFRFCLEVFPRGTDETGTPHQLAAFICLDRHELPADVQPAWALKGVRWSISVLNHAGRESVEMTDEFNFNHETNNRGCIKDFLLCEEMTQANGWLTDYDELCIEAAVNLLHACPATEP